jgi:hypothetical protein
MAFKIKTLNHSPQWYYDHCTEEDGGSAAFRAMLKNDMAYIGADNDSKATYQEKIYTYEETWNAVLADRSDVTTELMGEVLEREALAGFTPHEQYAGEPFKTFDRLMTKHGLNEDMVREFLKWRSRKQAVAKKRRNRMSDPKKTKSVTERWFEIKQRGR